MATIRVQCPSCHVEFRHQKRAWRKSRILCPHCRQPVPVEPVCAPTVDFSTVLARTGGTTFGIKSTARALLLGVSLLAVPLVGFLLILVARNLAGFPTEQRAIEGQSTAAGSWIARWAEDGSTLVVEGSEVKTVRLIGVDAPLIPHSTRGVFSWGREAREALMDLISGEEVMLEEEQRRNTVDRPGHVHAFVYRKRDNLLVNLELIRQGHARSGRTMHRLFGDFNEAEGKAIHFELGLWNPDVFLSNDRSIITLEPHESEGPVLVYNVLGSDTYHTTACSALKKTSPANVREIPLEQAKARCRKCSNCARADSGLGRSRED